MLWYGTQTLFKNKGLSQVAENAANRESSALKPLYPRSCSFWGDWDPMTDYCGGLKTPASHHSSGQLWRTITTSEHPALPMKFFLCPSLILPFSATGCFPNSTPSLTSSTIICLCFRKLNCMQECSKGKRRRSQRRCPTKVTRRMMIELARFLPWQTVTGPSVVSLVLFLTLISHCLHLGQRDHI